MSTDVIPTMPDIDCPTWCARDHAADWQMHVAVGRDTRGIPMADGTVGHRTRPESEWLAMFEPLHLRLLSQVDLGSYEHARVDIQRGVDGVTCLYVTAEGVLTSAQARTFAADLLAAADRLDTITGL